MVQIPDQKTSVHCTPVPTSAFASTIMANFATQLKDRFFGLVDRVAGCGRTGVKEAPKSAPAPAVHEHVEIRPRGPNVSGGSEAGVN